MKLQWFLAATLTLGGTTVWSADAPVITTEQLLTTHASWDGKPYPAYPSGQPETTVLRITVPPRATLPWHTHPIINVGYMLSGALEVENRATGKKRRYALAIRFRNSSAASIAGGIPATNPRSSWCSMLASSGNR